MTIEAKIIVAGNIDPSIDIDNEVYDELINNPNDEDEIKDILDNFLYNSSLINLSINAPEEFAMTIVFKNKEDFQKAMSGSPIAVLFKED